MKPILILLASTLAVQTPKDPSLSSAPRRPEHRADHSEGIWPSDRLLNLLLIRIGHQIADRYELPDDRRSQIRNAFVERWSTFLRDHRSELQPLVNEFLEMRLELTPPDESRVRDWAGRARPVFEKIKQQVGQSRRQVEEALGPHQRGKIAAEAMVIEAGLQFAELKLSQYATGAFDDVDFWQPHGMTPEAVQQLRESRRRRRRETLAEIRRNRSPLDQIAAELSAWERFTADFIRIYDLDEGQRTAVLSCLHELSERAKDHRRRYRQEIAELEKRIAGGAETENQVREIKARLGSLYGPIDDMFVELQSRLSTIPTSQQRERVKAVSESVP